MLKPDALWSLTDHVCRVCFGRVLERIDADGARVVRCANCGTQIAGPVRSLCCCGITTGDGRLAGLQCQRNPTPTPEQPSEVHVVFKGQVG